MPTKVTFQNCEFSFVDSDIVNPEDCIFAGEYNPHNVRGWLLHDHGFTICIVYADSLQDAIDIAVDNDKMDRYQIEESDYADYGINTDEPTCAFLGNAGEPFDIDTLGYVELPSPKKSIVAQYGNEINAISAHLGC